MIGAKANVSQVTSLEKGLAATLTQTSNELARSECLDTEQRAEVYTILKSLRSTSEAHREMLKRLAGSMKARKGDA